MFCFTLRHFAMIGVVLAMLVQAVRIEAAEGIVWQTDLKRAYDQAKKGKMPLVVYLYSADANGPLPFCRSFESITLSSREVAQYKDLALFVRVDIGRDDDVGSVAELTRVLNVTGVPCVTVCECRDDGVLVRAPFFGDALKSEFVTYLRRTILDKKLSIKLNGRPVCTDEEYVRGVTLFQREQQELQKELSVADRARAKLLNNMRAQGGFRMADLRAIDSERAQAQVRMATLLVQLAELNSPDITEFCRLELERHNAVTDAAVFLQDDLGIVTIDGVLSGEFAVTMAQSIITRSEEMLAKELATLDAALDAATRKINQRMESLVRQSRPTVSNVARSPWLPPIGR